RTKCVFDGDSEIGRCGLLPAVYPPLCPLPQHAEPGAGDKGENPSGDQSWVGPTPEDPSERQEAGAGGVADCTKHGDGDAVPLAASCDDRPDVRSRSRSDPDERLVVHHSSWRLPFIPTPREV